MKKIKTGTLIMALLLIISAMRAQDHQEKVVTVPEIKTFEASAITHYSVLSGGKLLSDGGGTISVIGICWSRTDPDPDLTDHKLTTKQSTFQRYLQCLEPGTEYFARAFASNEAGTAYGNTIHFTTLSEQDGSVSDIEGNIYRTVKIGDRIWLAENLRTVHFNNGAAIPTTVDEIFEEENPVYQWPANGEEDLTGLYGRLYTWHVVSDNRKLCPCGWHVPGNEEWMELIDFLGGQEEAGGRLKDAGTRNWMRPNAGADNESSFSALPSGIRDYTSSYAWFGKSATFWTSTENDEDDALSYTLDHLNSEATENVYSKKAGYAVRCIKDRE